MDTNQEQKTPEKDIGAVWVKKAQSGAQFLSVVLDLNQFGINQKVNLVGFKNKNKKETKHPDFRVFVSNRETASPTPAAPAVASADIDI
jgi:uncharacterized protein (DUF736 family)